MTTTTLTTSTSWSFDPLRAMLSPNAEASQPFVRWAWRYLLVHLAFRYTKGQLSSSDLHPYLVICAGLMLAAFAFTFSGLRLLRASKALASLAMAIELAID